MSAFRLSLLLPASALLLSACVSTPGPEVKGSGRCDASQLGWAIGQPANEPNIRRLSREWCRPGQPDRPQHHHHQGHPPDRLRVFVDKDNVITSTRCE